MLNRHTDPINYLVIGHITSDLLAGGASQMGGTVTYASLTASALGHSPGIVTAKGVHAPLGSLEKFPIAGIESDISTTFENLDTPRGRSQFIHHVAPLIAPYHIPESWRSTPLVHLAPVADEIDYAVLRLFPASFIGLTPQGWLRTWDAAGRVRRADWLEASFILPQVDAVVMSIEDIAGEWRLAEDFAAACATLVVTEGERGCRVFTQGEVVRVPAIPVEAVDTTGAGDIFATAFFVIFEQSGDPIHAAQIACQLAGHSVTRRGLAGIPTLDEVEAALFHSRESAWA